MNKDSVSKRIHEARVEARDMKRFGRKEISAFRLKYQDINALMVLLVEIGERLKKCSRRQLGLSEETVWMVEKYGL
ncbi:MAG: hypothetical protein C9356_11705 [Oleiphilus sp.]|nr:MAG: hypothetical protein C9356_11705 [Oleiphilus sp.]